MEDGQERVGSGIGKTNQEAVARLLVRNNLGKTVALGWTREEEFARYSGQRAPRLTGWGV